MALMNEQYNKCVTLSRNIVRYFCLANERDF